MLSSASGTVSVFLQSVPCHNLLWKYAHKEYSAEVLYFWHHIIEYRHLLEEASNPSLIRAHEDLMVDMYIRENSEHALNLPYELLKRIRSNPHSTEIWLEIQDEVALLIRHGPYMHLAFELNGKISSSWSLLLDRVSVREAGEIFYEILFAKAPSLRKLFRKDISSQAEMLTEMINSCVTVLVNIEQLADLVIGLGERHRQYGVLPEHFKVVGEALLEMLHSVLNTDFDQETQRAWITVYELLSTLMIMSLDSKQVNQYIVEERAIPKQKNKPRNNSMKPEITIEIHESNRFTLANDIRQPTYQCLVFVLIGVAIGIIAGLLFVYA